MPRNRFTALIAGGVLVVVALVVGFVVLGDDEQPTTDSPPTETGVAPPPTASPTTAPAVDSSDEGDDGAPSAPQYVWKPVKIGGGGNISGISSAADGSLIARSDTYGAYLRPAGASDWHQLLTTEALPEQFHVPKMGKGVQAVTIAPSDPSRLYLMWAGHVLASTDAGATWTTTPFEPVRTDANANFAKGFGDKMVVDPADPDVVLVGSPDEPLRISTDGGATWTDTDLPIGLTQSRLDEDYGGEIRSVGTTGLAFDPTSPVEGGRTSVVFAASWGNGVYRSDDGGTTWSSIGGPTTVHHAAFDASGAYYASSGDLTGPWTVERFADGAWTDITPSDWNPQGLAAVENPFIAPSPATPGTVVLGYANQMFVTRDGGASWDDLSWGDDGGDITWYLSEDDDYYLVASDLIFDPVVPDLLWLTTGEGVQQATLPADDDELRWVEVTRGIENMVSTDVASMRNAPPVFGVYDFGQFSGSSNYDDFSLVKGPVDFFSGTTSVAASPFADGYAVSATTDYVPGEYRVSSSFTDDGGRSWTRFPKMPKDASSAKEFGYGTIAVSEPGNIVWAPGRYFPTETDDFQPYYTLDGGQSWEPVVLPGVDSYPVDSTGGFMFGQNRQTVVADEVTPGVFYLLMREVGLFRSVDKGVTWELRHEGEFTLGDSFFTAQLGALPGREGSLFYTDGPAGGHDFTGPQEHGGWPFLRSDDAGATWAPVEGVDKVLAFGFGAPAPGAEVGAIYLAGDVDGQYGLWQSVDDAASWTKLADQPLTVDWIGAVSGDRNLFGAVYVGTAGSSYVYGVPAG